MTERHSTDDLIRRLAAAPLPAPFRPAVSLAGVLALLTAGLGLFLMAFGLRPDLGSAWGQLAVQAKTVLPLLLAVAAVRLVFRSSRPGGRVALWPLAIPAALAVILFLQRLLVAEGPLVSELTGSTALACLVSITLLSLLPLAMGVFLLRRTAPTRPALTGALLGIATGAGVTAGYALHCTEDSPLFFVFWYGLAICLAGGLGAWSGHRFLRW